MDASKVIDFVQEIYSTEEFIPLHAPTFVGNESKYVSQTIESTFVSSVGGFVDDFEERIESFTGCGKAIATVNGTSALHAALVMAGVQRNDLVITQALTFVATCNVIFHMGAEPLFVDVSPISLGLCPIALETYLEEFAELRDIGCYHKESGQRIRAVVPMHTFGHPVELDEIVALCKKWQIVLVEDSAESLGSFYKGQHTGTLGEFGALSFNGNKIITTGGGILLCKSKKSGVSAKHLTTTAKKIHPYEFFHDIAGFNYRMPNLNAALGCAQLEQLTKLLVGKRKLAEKYEAFFEGAEYGFVKEPGYASSNYWLNAVRCSDKKNRDYLLECTNKVGVMTRPVWKLMNHLPMYKEARCGDLKNSIDLENTLVNLPSSPVRIK